MKFKNLYSQILLSSSLFLAMSIPLFASAVVKPIIKIDNLNAWVGQPVSSLLSHSKFGVPDEKIVVGDETIITYRQILGVSGNVEDKVVVNINCRRNFIYNDKSIVKAVSEDGTCQDTADFLPQSK